MGRGDHPRGGGAGRRGTRDRPLTYRVVAHRPMQLGGVLSHKGVDTGRGHPGGIRGAVVASECVQVWGRGGKKGLLALGRSTNGVGG